MVHVIVLAIHVNSLNAVRIKIAKVNVYSGTHNSTNKKEKPPIVNCSSIIVARLFTFK